MAFVSEEAWRTMHREAPPLIVWTQDKHNFGERGYTYGALYIADRTTWYLCGNAEFYGTREMDDHEMRQLIESPEVSDWWHNKGWKNPTT